MNNLQEWVYSRSPTTVQNLIVSVYGYNWANKKYSKPFKKMLNSLEKTERLSKEDLIRLQTKELRRLVKYAYNNVPYYHKVFKTHNVIPDDIKAIDDIKRIPILTKEEVRFNSKELISTEYHRWQYDVHHTSGTTGTALDVVWGHDATMKEYAFVERMKRRAGEVNSRELHVTFGGRTIVPMKQRGASFWRFNRAENQYLFSMHHLNKENLDYYIEKIRELHPSYIEGYPSLIFVVAEYMLEHEIESIPVKAVFTSSETLLDYQREKIEKAFQCKVFDRYGVTEIAASIGECELGSYHVDAEHDIIEFLKDGEDVSENEVGEMVCTNFINYAFPLIRYKIGDLAKPIGDSCPCGRGLPLVKEVIGRIEDILITRKGAYLGRLDHIFKEMRNIKESQIIQESIDNVTVKVVPRLGYSEKDSKRLLEEFNKRLGGDMNVEIQFVDEIPREKNGKFKAVISKVPLRF
ncbi:MAG: phenylacetate--CoA ligase family protein [Dehalococcoidia bacterium]|nr:MAG: phenylacetate--CoA ligase family protein [Dehalococcoidia bacterium]